MRVVAGLILALSLSAPVAAQEAPEAYFARHADAPDVKTVPPIKYKILKSGPADGVHPKRSSVVQVRYEGRFLDGKIFDSSKDDPDGAVSFPLNGLIPGWVTVLPLMRPGDQWIIYLPPEYAYGAAGKDTIPPSTPLEFTIELVAVG